MATQWNEPTWRVEAESWIRERLAALGHTVEGAIEHGHVRPWGTAVRTPTDNGTVWFKANIAPLAFEVPLVETLAAVRPDCTPTILATDVRRRWLLMEDAGAIVADLYGDPPPLAVWREFLHRYAELQIDLAPSAGALIDAGVPDRRLPELPRGLRRVLAEDRLVRPNPEVALSDDELERLHLILPALDEAAERLAALELPDSVQHDDLHEWNVCVRDGRYRFIDWGDACISQPLLSLWVPLDHVPPDQFEAARDAYLEPWTAFRPQEELVAACDAALLVAQVTGALKWELISSGLSDEERAGTEHAIPGRLRNLLEFACG